MNEDSRIREPKIMPPHDKCVWNEVELSKEERQSLEEAAKEAGCWSVGEYLRMAVADFLRTYEHDAQTDKSKSATNIIEFPKP